MGVALKRQGITAFSIIEKAADVGGVWRDNDYPGAACDIPSHLYSFSFEPNPDWTRVFAPQPEIHTYLRQCIDKYHLRRHLRLKSEVVACSFNEASACWYVTLGDGSTLAAKHVIAATGQLSRPFIPELSGLDCFAGAMFHSSRWQHSCNLGGANVAVVGTGASAAQFLPIIAEQAKTVTVFQRSAAYTLPRRDRSYSAFERWLFRRFAPLAALNRLRVFVQHEARALAFVQFPKLIEFFVKRQFERSLERQVSDSEMRQRLQPDYPMGCKRIVVSDDYLATFDKSNVRLVSDKIARVVRDGIQTEGGASHRADVIVFATGFDATSFLAPMRVKGRNGYELNQMWSDGAGAHLGISVPNFPNFFILYGPNTNLGHNSVIYMLESQIAHVMRCLKAVNLADADTIEVEQAPYHRFIARVRKRMKRTVWQQCRSWYLDERGRNTVNWPNFSAYYGWLARRQTLNVYSIKKHHGKSADIND